MNIIDISWPISPAMTQYKNRTAVSCQPFPCSAAYVTEHLYTLHTHTGTHVDAPLHMMQEGASVDQLSLDYFIGPCRVIDATNQINGITASFLRTCNLQPRERILIKTKNSFFSATDPFCAQFVYIDAEAAAFLAAIAIKTVGIDYLGIERNQPGHPTHTTLLQAGIGIIEGLRLASVQEGNYTLYCLPLALVGMDGAPARAVLHKHAPE